MIATIQVLAVLVMVAAVDRFADTGDGACLAASVLAPLIAGWIGAIADD